MARLKKTTAFSGAIIPEMVKVFTSMKSGHVTEIVTASREGGASLNILAGLTAGNFSAFWMGLVITALMGGAYLVSTLVPAGIFLVLCLALTWLRIQY